MRLNDFRVKHTIAVAAFATALVVGSAAGAAHAEPSPAAAAAAATDTRAAESGDSLAEIVVPARKRSEKLLEIPVAVVALSSESLESQGVYSLSDVAAVTPGLSFDSTIGGSGRNDRSFNEYLIRGMPPSTNQNPTTTVFIDGAPFVSGQISGLDDLERVEVLEGPQSAYFGRETFAGAINLVTRDPSKEFAATISGLAANRNYEDVRGSLEGSLIPDKLTARASVRYYTRDGSYNNQATGGSVTSTLGDQSTRSASLEFVATPVDDLKIKALYMYWQDRDGPGAQAFIGPSQSNCKFPAGNWFCGTVPDYLPNQPAVNTVVDAPLQAWLAAAAKPGVSLFAPPNKFGLERNAYHWSIGIDYDLPSLGLTLNSLTAVDNDKYGELQDLDDADTSGTPNPFLAFGGPYGQAFWNNPFLVESRIRDFSQELRLSSDPTKQFHWLLGVNYAWSRRDQTLAGAGSFNYFVADAPVSANDTGVFFSLNYDFTKQFSLAFEGREQRDQQSTVNNISAAFSNFTPRLIAQYKFTPDVMGYVTYSEGVNPGTFNSGILQLSAADQAQLINNYGATIVVKPEKLKNYEVGVKGRFFDNSLTLTADAYYDIWSDQINVAQVVFIENNSTKLTTANLNNGRVKITGLEFNADWIPVSHLTLHLSGAINDSKIEAGPCVTCSQITGSTDVTGNQLPNTSKLQANAGISYSNTLTPAWDWFARLDDSYKSGNYASADNTVKTPALNFLNFRAGLTSGELRIEAFCDNLANEKGATNLSLFYNVASPFETYARPDALVAGLPNLRTYGLRVRYKIGGKSGG